MKPKLVLKIVKLCLLRSKLPKSLQQDFSNLNFFQMQKIVSLYKQSPQSSEKLLITNFKISNAQKYRYLKKLISLKIIKKRHNEYSINI